jgi:hypothetical protein
MKQAAWIIAAACWIGITVAVMLWLRASILESFDKDSEKQLQDWQVWREKVRTEKAAGTAVVDRREPVSDFPPGVVLMKNYFGVCLVSAVVFNGLLFAFFSFLLFGALKDSTLPAGQVDDQQLANNGISTPALPEVINDE